MRAEIEPMTPPIRNMHRDANTGRPNVLAIIGVAVACLLWLGMLMADDAFKPKAADACVFMPTVDSAGPDWH